MVVGDGLTSELGQSSFDLCGLISSHTPFLIALLYLGFLWSSRSDPRIGLEMPRRQAVNGR